MSTEDELGVAIELGEGGGGRFQGIPRLRVVRLRPDSSHANGSSTPIPGLNSTGRYAILGEVATTRHCLLLNIATGGVLPGMFHLEDFEDVPEDDL